MSIPRLDGVMLATPGKNPADLLKQLMSEGARWTYDVKWDGVRCTAYVDHGTVHLVNRQGTDISHQYPEVVAHLEAMYPDDALVFDGEMLCFDPDLGRPTFNRMQKRNAQSNTRVIKQLSVDTPATLMVFDLLHQNGADLTRVMLQGRLMLLERVAERFKAEGGGRIMASEWSLDGKMMWDLVRTQGLEGLIAKNNSSLYRPGRSSSWVKLKPTHRVTAIAYDWEYGKTGGARGATLGALFIGLLKQPGSIVEAGKVGTGFKMAELHPLIEHIEAWKADPGNHPPLLVEVEYQDLLDSGKLRFPVFMGERTDILWQDCTTDQLETS